MNVRKILSKKVSLVWLIAAILFFTLCVVEAVMLILAGSGFNSLTGFIKEGHYSCAEYCEAQGHPLYLHDVVTQACQCYSENEEPTDYMNLQSGVEIKYQEGVSCQT